MPFTLTILSRDDKSFSAREEIGKIVREIHGTIDQGVVRWLAKDVKVIEGGGPGSDHAGKLSGDRLELRTSGVANGKTFLAVMKLQLQKR